jgi:hypothetical protein
VRRNVKIFLIAAVLRQLDFDASEVRITWSVRPLDIGPLSNAGTVRGLTFADNYRPSRSHEFEPELAAILPRHRAVVVMPIIALNAGKQTQLSKRGQRRTALVWI